MDLTPYLNQVINADCLDFLVKLPPNSIDCVLIDPPYCSGGVKSLNARNKNTTAKYGTDRAVAYYDFVGDGKDQRVWGFWMQSVFRQFERVLKPNSYFFSFIDWRMLPALSDTIQLADLAWRGILAWNKGNQARPFPNAFKQQCEFILWGTKGDLPRPIEPTYHYGYIDAPINCVHGNLHPKDKSHATEKPVKLLSHLLRIVPKGETPPVVLDCFCGSGSTLEAAATLGLAYIGIEKSPEYAHIAQKRMRSILGGGGGLVVNTSLLYQ